MQYDAYGRAGQLNADADVLGDRRTASALLNVLDWLSHLSFAAPSLLAPELLTGEVGDTTAR